MSASGRNSIAMVHPPHSRPPSPFDAIAGYVLPLNDLTNIAAEHSTKRSSSSSKKSRSRSSSRSRGESRSRRATNNTHGVRDVTARKAALASCTVSLASATAHAHLNPPHNATDNSRSNNVIPFPMTNDGLTVDRGTGTPPSVGRSSSISFPVTESTPTITMPLLPSSPIRSPLRSLRRQRSSARLNVGFLRQRPLISSTTTTNNDTVTPVPMDVDPTPKHVESPNNKGVPTIGKRLRLQSTSSYSSFFSASSSGTSLSSSSSPTKKPKKQKHPKRVMASLRWLLVVYRSIAAARAARTSNSTHIASEEERNREEEQLEASEVLVLAKLRDYLLGMGMSVDVKSCSDSSVVQAATRVVTEEDSADLDSAAGGGGGGGYSSDGTRGSGGGDTLMFDMDDITVSAYPASTHSSSAQPVCYSMPSIGVPPPSPPPGQQQQQQKPRRKNAKTKNTANLVMPLPTLVATLILRHGNPDRDKVFSTTAAREGRRSESPLGRFVVHLDS